MKFSRSDFEMQRFESRRPTGQSVSNAYGIGSRSKCHEMAAFSFIRTWSPPPETGDGRGIPVSVSEADSLVSPF